MGRVREVAVIEGLQIGVDARIRVAHRTAPTGVPAFTAVDHRQTPLQLLAVSGHRQSPASGRFAPTPPCAAAPAAKAAYESAPADRTSDCRR